MLLIASTYHLPLDPREQALQKPYPPLGPLVAVGIAERLGIPVALYDPMFCPDPELFEEALRGHRPQKVLILADPHAVPQKQCTTRMRTVAQRMIHLARRAGAQVMAAGPDMSDHPEDYQEAHCVVVGEHESWLTDWLQGHALSGILPRRPNIKNLDQLPEPAWDHADLNAYAQRWRKRHGLWELPISTARGCPYRCNWCAKPTWGRSYQLRSPTSVIASITDLYARHKPDRIWFTDDIFAIRPTWLKEFRARLPHPIRYRCLTRADLVKDPDYVQDLAATGCEEVWLGAESGSDHVLTAMDKDVSVAEIEKASALLHAAGIRRGFFLQMGYPGETAADVHATRRMCRALKPEEIGISVSYPLPGTVFYERMKSRLTDSHWAESMENRLLFQHDLPQPFYDTARELLRTEHALINWTLDLSPTGLRRSAALPYHALRWPLERAKLAWYSRATHTSTGKKLTNATAE